MQEPSKDYIHEFGEDQAKKRLRVKFEPSDEWNFEPELKKGQSTHEKIPTHIIPPPPEQPASDQTSFTAEEGYENRPITYFDPKTKQNRPSQWVTKTQNAPQPRIPQPDKEGHVSFPAEGITETDLKEMIQSAVLHMMNAPTPEDYSLLDEQKQEIEALIVECWDRPGVMSICFHESVEKDEAVVGILVDPTNSQNWVFMKEEVIYKLPYAYKESLHSFASSVWKKKGLMLEAELPNTEQIQLLRTQIAAAHREADARYNEVSHQSTGYTMGNIFEPNRQNFPNPQEGHRNALADGQYRALKKRAIDLEVQLRRLEKRLKKSNS